VPEIMAGQVQWPGRLDRPRRQSARPPEALAGELLPLPFARRLAQAKKTKWPPGTPNTKTKPYEAAPAETQAVAEKGSKSPFRR